MKTLFHWMLAAGMLVTGSINTLSTKAADLTCATNRAGQSVEFNHPFVQAAGMFIGEALCFAAFHIARWRARASGQEYPTAKPHSRLIFLLPALCDMTGTSLMYVGLSLTSSSLFQMLRGSVVIFTAILSVVFLKRKLTQANWLGALLVLVGVGIVGSATVVCPDASSSGGGSGSSAMLGNVLIIAAQVIVAVQMVVEEKFIGGYDIPALQVVGWEGMWGFTILGGLVLPVMYFIKSPSQFCSAPACGDVTYPADCSHFEDSLDAFTQIGNSWKVALFLGLNLCSIAFFNFLGVSITKHINAATRMVLDSCRTLIIWCFSLAIGWEKFCWVQIVGFLILSSGIFVYNEVLRVPGLKYADADGSGAGGADAAKLLAAEEIGEDDYDALAGDYASSGSLNASGKKGRR